MSELKKWVTIDFVEKLEQLGCSESVAIFIQVISAIVVILLLAWAADEFTKIVLRKIVPLIVQRTKNNWDDIFLENRVFANIAHVTPGIVIMSLDHYIMASWVEEMVDKGAKIYFIIVFLLFFNAFINALNDIFMQTQRHRENYIKIYLQVIKLLVFSLAVIAIISIILGEDLWKLLTGLGAFATVLMIVYKDTILGFVAGIQLSANKMLKIGDWVSIPKHNADGTVIDISLNTVKIQNWDKTITTVPTYSLMSDSFSNWKGMEESDGRRIKRYVKIDVDSIHFLNEEEIERLAKIKLLTDYVETKKEEIAQSRSTENEEVNQRKITNIGTFRKYIEEYLKANPLVNQEMTFLVRQLQPTETGLPLEIYIFCKDKVWANYERFQSDLFDHIFAIAPEFGLRIFQNPTASAFLKLARSEE